MTEHSDCQGFSIIISPKTKVKQVQEKNSPRGQTKPKH